eukprot:4354834-Prymnesium_polylepis.1
MRAPIVFLTHDDHPGLVAAAIGQLHRVCAHAHIGQPSRPAEGGANKRTPQSTIDGAAGKDTYMYEPEKVIAERLAKGVTQYQVKWAGWDAKHNTSSTWEPLEHLAGCEDLIADMKERKKQKDAELEAAAQAKK